MNAVAAVRQTDLAPTAVVLDVGNVLLGWDPRRLYRKLLPDERAVDEFLSTVCTPAWHDAHDRGRPFAEGVRLLCEQHPQHRELIEAYRSRWDEMVGPPIHTSVQVFYDLKRAGVACYALTNYPIEAWGQALRRYPFLRWFDGTVVSGRERVAKPDAAVFRRLLARYALDASRTAFVDDRADNVAAARAVGIRAVQFTSGGQLRRDLQRMALPV